MIKEEVAGLTVGYHKQKTPNINITVARTVISAPCISLRMLHRAEMSVNLTQMVIKTGFFAYISPIKVMC